MTRSYLAPDPRAIFKEHERRLAVLERRLNPATTTPRRRSPSTHITVAAADTLPELAASATYRCDGVDDQVEIQAAIDQAFASGAGGTVLLLAGAFNTSATVTLRSGVSIEGERGSFVLYSGASYAFSNDHGGFGKDRSTLRHLVIQAPTGGGVQFKAGSSFCIIDSCEITSGGAAATSTIPAVETQGIGNRIVNSFVTVEPSGPFDTYAIWQLSSLPSETIIRGNLIRGVGGIMIDGGDRVFISDNNINSSGEGAFPGVHLSGGVAYATVVGNLIDDFGRQGILLTSADHCTVVGNTIINTGQETANTYDAIRIEASAGANNIQGNTLRNSLPGARHAISIAATSADNLVTNNDLMSDASWASGVALSDAGTGTITGPGNRPGGGAAAHTHTDADIPASIARDTEVTSAISTHEAATDPHTGYATDADLTAHAATAHGGTHPDLATHDTLGLATQAELDAHAATAHGGSSTGQAATPYYVPVGETFTVPEYAQVLFHEPITVDGALDISGLLIEIIDPPDLSSDIADLHVLVSMEP